MAQNETYAKHTRAQSSKPSTVITHGTPPAATIPHGRENGQQNVRQSRIFSSADISQYRRGNYTCRSRRWSTRKIIATTAVSLLLLMCAALGITSKLVLDDAMSMQDQAPALIQKLITGDYTSASQIADGIASSASRMHALTNNPLWGAASILPGIGADITSACAFAAAFDDLSKALIVPTTRTLVQESPGGIIKNDGSFNADALRTALVCVSNAAPTIQSHDAKISALPRPMIDQVSTLSRRVRKAFSAMARFSSASSQLASSIHFLLGADGTPRTYLVVAQTNSELHATGGFTGSYSFATVENGVVSLGEFDGIWNLGRFGNAETFNVGEPALTNEETTLFGRRASMTPGDATYNPDFPRAATILSEQALSLAGVDVDGVIASDPIFIQQLLYATGKVTTSDGTVLDTTNAARILLRDMYWERSEEEQNSFYSEVGALVFGKLFDSFQSINLVEFAKALARSSDNRNLLCWFDNSDAQTSMEAYGLAGNLQTDTSIPVLGVYANSGTAGKMSWYYSEKTHLGKRQTDENGNVTVRATTIVKNNLSTAEAPSLPACIKGPVKNGEMRHWIYLYAPLKGSISDIQINNQGRYLTNRSTEYYPQPSGTLTESTYNGRQVWFTAVGLLPEQEATISYTITLSPEATSQDITIDRSPSAAQIAQWK